MGLLKKLGSTGMFGLAGLAASGGLGGKGGLKGLIGIGLGGIAGATLLGGHHHKARSPSMPAANPMGAGAPPQPSQFKDDASYFAALGAWMHGSGGAGAPVASAPLPQQQPMGIGGAAMGPR